MRGKQDLGLSINNNLVNFHTRKSRFLVTKEDSLGCSLFFKKIKLYVTKQGSLVLPFLTCWLHFLLVKLYSPDVRAFLQMDKIRNFSDASEDEDEKVRPFPNLRCDSSAAVYPRPAALNPFFRVNSKVCPPGKRPLSTGNLWWLRFSLSLLLNLTKHWDNVFLHRWQNNSTSGNINLGPSANPQYVYTTQIPNSPHSVSNTDGRPAGLVTLFWPANLHGTF